MLIIALAVAVRAWHIGTQSLWTDELFSRYYATLFSVKFLWTTGFVNEDSPPLYYMAIAGWMHLFGDSEAAMRSLSLVASVLVLPIIMLIGRELLDQRRGLIAALVFALSPTQISFAQEARTYALLLLPISAALLAVARFLRGDQRARNLWLYGLGGFAAVYCHATATFFLAACNIAVLLYLTYLPAVDRRDALRRWIIANVLLALVCLPEGYAMLLQGRSGAGIQWIGPFQPVDVVRSFTSLVTGVETPVKQPGAELTLLLLLALAACVVSAWPGRRAACVLIAIPVIFCLLIAAASLLHTIFIARVFCWLGIPLALLVAHGLVIPSWPRPVLWCIVLLTGVIGLYYQFTSEQKEPWRDLFAQIEPDLARADHVVLAPLTDPTAFAYYTPALTNLQLLPAPPTGNIENDQMPDRMGIRRTTRDAVVRDIRTGQHVWLILRTPDLPYVTSLLAELPPPKRDIERQCGKVMCLAALSW
jgi:4-amino-4-deoxy-L-arabinose transferase-like glycosyltransferase